MRVCRGLTFARRESAVPLQEYGLGWRICFPRPLLCIPCPYLWAKSLLRKSSLYFLLQSAVRRKHFLHLPLLRSAAERDDDDPCDRIALSRLLDGIHRQDWNRDGIGGRSTPTVLHGGSKKGGLHDVYVRADRVKASMSKEAGETERERERACLLILRKPLMPV